MQRTPLTDVQKGDLKRVSDYLNTIKSVQGRFTQLAADGRSVQGTFYSEEARPHPLRV